MKRNNAEIKSFIHHCRFEKNLSSKTIKAYLTDLQQFTEFISNYDEAKEIIGVSKTEIRNYIASISHLKPKSIKRKVATLKALFNYLEFEDILTSNPFRKMRIKIHEPKNLPRVMTIDEVCQFLKAAYDVRKKQVNKDMHSYYEAYRNILILELLFATGARVSEISAIQLVRFNILTGDLVLQGKGSKERCIQICNATILTELNNYTRIYKNKIDLSGGYIFVNRSGKCLSDQSIRNILKVLQKQTQIKRHITPHTFRHTLATLLLENDVDIKYIQGILGHSSIATTQIYTHVNSQKQRQILDSKHPRSVIIP